MEEDFLITGKPLQRYFELNEALFKFSELFQYDKGDDRTIVIVGASFIDILLEHILLAFFPEEDKEVEILFQFDQSLGTYSNKVRVIYSLGLIDKIIKDDLKIIGKIRNHFAHDLYASFDNAHVASWCKELKWHKISMMCEPPIEVTIRDLYQVGVHQLIAHLNGVVGIARTEKRKIQNNY